MRLYPFVSNWPSLQSMAREVLKDHPELRTELIDILAWARDEIADGGSEAGECEHAERDILDLLEEK